MFNQFFRIGKPQKRLCERVVLLVYPGIVDLELICKICWLNTITAPKAVTDPKQTVWIRYVYRSEGQPFTFHLFIPHLPYPTKKTISRYFLANLNTTASVWLLPCKQHQVLSRPKKHLVPDGLRFLTQHDWILNTCILTVGKPCA